MASSSDKQKILVVDDNRTNIKILIETLKDDYYISFAKSGQKALEIIRLDQPDLILLDIMMPEMDGYQVCRILKSDKKTGNIPVIFITARKEDEDETKGFEVGAVDYITKPFSTAIVKARVKTHLSLKIARETLKRHNIVLEQQFTESARELEETKVEATRVRWLNETFSRYLSPQLISQLHALHDKDLLEAQRRDVTVLFADLRGFTRVCQEEAPMEIAELVNEFLTNMVNCIERHDGMVDKFIGDEIMAIFGAPLTNEFHVIKALLAAVDMIESHKIWLLKRQNLKKPALPIGIGLATGEVVVGNIGTSKRMEYTVLGHPVNLGARLCDLASAHEILTIDASRKAAVNAFEKSNNDGSIPNFQFIHRGNVVLKNIMEPVDIYQVSI
ncbi:MAG: adenylate/guanylate cyclase domain-containing protein [Thermodesulfobacteriota bacterium]|nr:adenylate/guanylate cyclase domain-containing protein [Thermodesulfobacteriota bacterium]